MTNEQYNQLSYRIIACAMAVHRNLGPGLLESAYHACLVHELRAGGIHFREQVHLPITYENNQVPKAYVIDILVENVIVLELKSVEVLHPIHFTQTLTYLKLGNFKLGLLLNFNEALMKKGIHRMVNGF